MKQTEKLFFTVRLTMACAIFLLLFFGIHFFPDLTSRGIVSLIQDNSLYENAVEKTAFLIKELVEIWS